MCQCVTLTLNGFGRRQSLASVLRACLCAGFISHGCATPTSWHDTLHLVCVLLLLLLLLQLRLLLFLCLLLPLNAIYGLQFAPIFASRPPPTPAALVHPHEFLWPRHVAHCASGAKVLKWLQRCRGTAAIAPNWDMLLALAHILIVSAPVQLAILNAQTHNPQAPTKPVPDPAKLAKSLSTAPPSISICTALGHRMWVNAHQCVACSLNGQPVST